MTEDSETAGSGASAGADQPGEASAGPADSAGVGLAGDGDISASEKSDDEMADDPSHFQQYADNINNFFATVHAENSIFGNASSARRVAGNISAVEVLSALDHFVPPAAYGEATSQLAEQRLVMLSGPDGIGKRTSALAALSAVANSAQPVTSLPPSRTLGELAEHQHFKAGRGYLVQDWVAPATSDSSLGFDIDLLRRALHKHGAYLVITSGTQVGQNRSLAGAVLTWQPPDPVTVFDGRLPTSGVAMSDADLCRVRDRLASVRHPGDVVAVLRRLCDGADVALDVLGDADNERVRDWFDRKPGPRELLSVAALAFLDGSPESKFQSRLSRLVELAGARVPGESLSALVGTENGFHVWFPQHESHGDDGLDEVFRELGAGDRSSGDRLRRFRSPRYRELVIAELTDRYEFELWDSLRYWVNELAAEPPSMIQVRLALGLAQYARHAPSDVRTTFLDPWADGTLGERLSAACLLSWMCIDDSLAATALQIAVRWSRGSGTRRAVTAAMALGSELGIRYQPEALSWLWYLVQRNETVSRTARMSLGNLLCAAVDDPASATTVLRYLNGGLRQLLENGAGRPEHGSFTSHVRKATAAVMAVLTTRPEGSAESMTAVILRTLPANAPVLGQLWAEVLRSWPHRTAAIDELGTVLEAMRDDDEALQAIRAFGVFVRANLSDQESQLLRRDLGHALYESDTTASPKLISALLAALQQRIATLPVTGRDL